MNFKSKNREHKLFESLSSEWWNEDGKFKILHKILPLRMKYIVDQINIDKISNLKILDIGCGGGLICESLCKLGASVTGMDFVKKNIIVAKNHSKENGLKISYLYKDIERDNINFKYDIIIMFEVLEHLDDWEIFLFKIKKNLNKNGIIIISTINRNLVSKFTALFLAEEILKWVPKGTHKFKKLIKPKELDNVLNKLNFVKQDINGMVFNPLSLEWEFSKSTAINYFCTYKKIS